MTEQELRMLVRQAIARHRATSSLASGVLSSGDTPSFTGVRAVTDPAHTMFILPSGADADGPCIIEPAVLCNHCGYCKSLGH